MEGKELATSPAYPDLEVEKESEDDEVDVPNPAHFPMNLSWENLNYTIKIKKKKRQLIKNVSGNVNAGQLLAIMGPSGAGKTTMLNTLAGRVNPRQVTGKILVNGHPIDRRRFKHLSGFVTQDDVMHPFLTVTETLAFSALLRLPSSMSFAQKRARVELTIQRLGLTKCAGTYIGNTIIRGVSGGEKKRVNIGREILTDPSVLFLDEPTSGLDSFSSLGLVELLSKMAHQDRRTIICTIHQPRADIFNLFDKLLLMANGEVIFFGPARSAIEYFSALNFVCPTNMNPADYFIDIVTPDSRSPKANEVKAKQVDGLIEAWPERKEFHDQTNDTNSELTEKITSEKLPRKPNIFAQMMYLSVRNTMNTLRDKQYLAIRLIVALLMGLVIGFLYFQIDEDQDNIQNIQGFLFFSCVFLSFNELNAAIGVIPMEKGIYLHEIRASAYGVSSYFFSKVISDIPIRLIQPIIYCNTAYWLVGIRPAGFGFFFLVAVLFSFVSSSMGFWLGTLAPTPQIAIALSTLGNILTMMFGGFFIIRKNIQGYFYWLNYLSFISYGFEIMIINEFEDRDFGCDAESAATTGCLTGNGVIKDLDFQDFSYDICFPSLVAFGVGFLALGYLTMRIQRMLRF